MNKIIIDFDSSIYAISSACDCARWEYRGTQWDSKAIAVKALESDGKDISELVRVVNPEPWENVSFTINKYMNGLMNDLNNPFNFTILVSGGSGNFRYGIATIKPYKGNRVQELPFHFNAVKDYVISNFDAKRVVPFYEVDDVVGMIYNEGDLIVSIDKDLDQLPGDHYNPNKKEYYDVSTIDSIRNFYCQTLTGDSTDNILGLYGIGKSSSYLKQIKELEEEKDMYELVRSLYESRFGSYAHLFLLENCRLLHLLRNPENTYIPVWMEHLLEDKSFYLDKSITENLFINE